MTKKTTLTPMDHHRIGQRLPKIARMVERELSKAAGGKFVGFSLLTWGGVDATLAGNPDGMNRSQYVANVTRESATAALKETIARWERPDHGELGIPQKPLGGMGRAN
jgi:D-serine deaminase-like pyridoxal phosphate-dependent protein